MFSADCVMGLFMVKRRQLIKNAVVVIYKNVVFVMFYQLIKFQAQKFNIIRVCAPGAV